MQTLTLNNGQTVPTVGLGTWKAEPGAVAETVRYALTQAGYRHIDCAAVYRNEPEIGHAFHEVFTGQSIARETVFVTSKLWNTMHRAENVVRACKQTLHDLQLEYLDLYLMHYGIAFDSTQNTTHPLDNTGRIQTEAVPIAETWQALEELVDQGLVRGIGVANFTVMMLHDLLASARIAPAMNQVELHPYLPQHDLVRYCHEQNVAVTAYSPLAAPGGAGKDFPKLLADPSVLRIAETHQKTPAQVLLRWGVQRNTVVIPKSTNPARILENHTIFDFSLREEEMRDLSNLDRNQRVVNPATNWQMPYFS